MSISNSISPERLALIADAREAQERALADAALKSALADARTVGIFGARVIVFRPETQVGFPSPVTKPDVLH